MTIETFLKAVRQRSQDGPEFEALTFRRDEAVERIFARGEEEGWVDPSGDPVRWGVYLQRAEPPKQGYCVYQLERSMNYFRCFDDLREAIAYRLYLEAWSRGCRFSDDTPPSLP